MDNNKDTLIYDDVWREYHRQYQLYHDLDEKYKKETNQAIKDKHWDEQGQILKYMDQLADYMDRHSKFEYHKARF